MTPEEKYISEVGIDHRKKYAQFFTPEHIADFMCSWVLRDNYEDTHARLLEPALGLGIFTRKAREINDGLVVKAFDIDPNIFQRAETLFKGYEKMEIHNEDYMQSTWEDKYELIVCNPPYLKFHDYDNNRYVEEVNNKVGINLKKTSNLYTLFLIKSVTQLKEGGRMAYIVPSEFLNADYGVEVKKYLLESGVLEHLIVIDYNQNTFDGAITTACILLCSKNVDNSKVRFSVVKDVADLSRSLDYYREYAYEDISPYIKWRKYYEEATVNSSSRLVPFSTFAKVSRGIATGANEYFIFNQSKADFYHIPAQCLLPCICRSIDVSSIFFTQEQFAALKEQDKKIYLFNGMKMEEDEAVKSYLQKGVREEIDKRYLTSCRTPWYALENRKAAPIWVGVFNRGGLKFVRNTTSVANLTTFHCVYPNNSIDVRLLFIYLLTDLAKDIFKDNARQYGNGLTKFEPNDLNKGQMVDLRVLGEKEKNILIKAYSILEYGVEDQDVIIDEIDRVFRSIYFGKSWDKDIERLNRSLEKYASFSRNAPDMKESGYGRDSKHQAMAVQLSLF